MVLICQMDVGQLPNSKITLTPPHMLSKNTKMHTLQQFQLIFSYSRHLTTPRRNNLNLFGPASVLTDSKEEPCGFTTGGKTSMYINDLGRPGTSLSQDPFPIKLEALH